MSTEVVLQGGVVLYISLEMSRTWILARLLGANQQLNPTDIYLGRITPEQKLSIKGVIALFADSPLCIRDDVSELSDIVKAVQVVHSREGRLDLVVLDFIQNATVRGVNLQNERMALAAARLQRLAVETGACVVVLSQFSNDQVREKGKGIMSFRYASELGHAADVAVELVPGTDGTASLLVRKNRAGRTGQINVRWAGNYSRFEEIR